ncbi:MAG: ribose 5-phosphate isomerase B [Tannerellaceae bacterium]|jgi:ribose 5-phosphate isomerase B|nr:ribose 5-phosphate isomerase B [Tannerellaceae bacterium]
MSLIIGLCSDHAGFLMKECVRIRLEDDHIRYKDFGTFSAHSCDYPDFAHPLAEAVEKGEVQVGIAVCGTGNGIAMTLNKHRDIRAALCWDTAVAHLSRAHNDANVLVLPGRFISSETALKVLGVFLDTAFEGGRHKRRVDKIRVAE